MVDILWADYAYPGGDLTGYVGVVRYLQTRNGSSRSKYDLTRAEVDAHHAAGRAVAAFWQDGGSSAGLGYDRGVRDAQRANDEADLLDAPSWWPAHFAVDDPTLTGPMVRPYFEGVLTASRRPVGGYGSYAICEYLAKELGIRFLIQTTSWSNGQISPNAWLLQRDHNVTSGTSRIDVDPLLVPYPPNPWRPPVAVMTPDQRLAAFRAEGLPIVEVRNWRTNDRNLAGKGPAGPKHGTLNHHTGGDTADPLRYASSILYDGRSDLPGPLCHEGLDVDKGVLYLVGSGRTNHAGSGDPDTLNLYLADAMPTDREVRPDQSGPSDGNSALYGLEMMYSGARDLPRVGWVAMVKWNAAYLRFHGWTGESAGGHREWTNQKPDPGHVDLAKLRRDIDACLALPPGVWPKTAPPPTPEPDRTEHEMRLVRNNTPGSTFDKGFGAVYLTGPAVWQHVPTIEQLNALQLAWGPFINVGDGDLAKMRDAYWTTMETLKGWLNPPAGAAATAAPEADAAPGAAVGAQDASLPECADPSDLANA